MFAFASFMYFNEFRPPGLLTSVASCSIYVVVSDVGACGAFCGDDRSVLVRRLLVGWVTATVYQRDVARRLGARAEA